MIFSKTKMNRQKQTIRTAEAVAGEIIHLFGLYGQDDYDGEPVSQASHMIQCAMHAMDGNGDSELILGAFLHDIGHLLKHTIATEAMGSYGAVNHEGLGAAYLRRNGFSERICAMVEGHVAAKRYLVATDPTYRSKLSEASLQTLQWQGGPMQEEEIAAFAESRFFNDVIKVRLWDEEAKNTDAVLLPLSHFHNLLINYLNDQNN